MQASLEARVPYTDHVLVERMFRLPLRCKIGVDPQETAPYLSSGALENRGTLLLKKDLARTRATPPTFALGESKEGKFSYAGANMVSRPVALLGI